MHKRTSRCQCKRKHTWAGAQRTSVSEPFKPIREAITTAEATPRLLSERSSVSTGSVPLSLTGRANPSKFTYAQEDHQMSAQEGAHLGWSSACLRQRAHDRCESRHDHGALNADLLQVELGDGVGAHLVDWDLVEHLNLEVAEDSS